MRCQRQSERQFYCETNSIKLFPNIPDLSIHDIWRGIFIKCFGFEGRKWDLILSVPDHCLSFYFVSNV